MASPMEHPERVPGKGARGRPRDPGADRALLETALQHLARYGYAGMSLTAVAGDAGYNKPTLYRRWQSKAELVGAALELVAPLPPPEPTGDTRRDLRRALEHFHDWLQGDQLALLGTVLVEQERHPELLGLYRLRLSRRHRHAVRALLESAAARGELRDDADLELAVELLLGAVQGRQIGVGEGPKDLPGRIVALVLEGLRAPG